MKDPTFSTMRSGEHFLTKKKKGRKAYQDLVELYWTRPVVEVVPPEVPPDTVTFE